MKHPRSILLALVVGTVVLSGVSGPAQAEAARSELGHVAGVVKAAKAGPLESAIVYVYDLSTFELTKVLTDAKGSFLFRGLPAGLYHVVAFKSGFLPGVIEMSRPAAKLNQFLDFDLIEERVAEAGEGGSYWDVRSRIPQDVLRDIDQVLMAAVEPLPGNRLQIPARFRGGVEAIGGVDELAAAADASQVTGGRVDLEGDFHGVALAVEGGFRRLESELGSAAAEGMTRNVSLDLTVANDARIQVSHANHRLLTGARTAAPIDFERYLVRYSQPHARGRSTFAAHLTEQSNFYNQGLLATTELPGASRTLRVEGSYAASFGDRTSFETGLSYRDRQIVDSSTPEVSLFGPAERVDWFGKGDFRVRPTMLVEYGLYTVLRDGDLALAPQGGLVVQLSDRWQAAARLSGRLHESRPLYGADFLPALHGDGRACMQGEELCYQLLLTRATGDDDSLSLGAIHREFGETLRLYFSDDFFDQLDSLYLVPGDRLPELTVSVSRRLSPNVLARWQSNFATGGGGAFVGTGRDGYENEVTYLVASMDTLFRNTSTGVFFAFHRYEQQLNPIDPGLLEIAAVATERLQLKLTQNLDMLLDLPADWALRLNMEVSRDTAEEDSDELRRRVLGGIAVKF